MMIESMAEDIAAALQHTDHCLVLAESCTGGNIAAQLAQVAGISQHWCGSLVTYRDDSKRQWLDVDADLIAKHTAVSAAVTEAMVRGALATTPEATLGAAVTGHLGPDAPADLDGKIFIASLFRDGGGDVVSAQLQSTTRQARMREATQAALQWILMALSKA